jgi:hypothetical protein
LNNFGIHSPYFKGAFFHDPIDQIKVVEKKTSIVGGHNAWSGLSIYSMPVFGSMMALVGPLYQLSTTGLCDQFSRRFTIYVKGQIVLLIYNLINSFSSALSAHGNARNRYKLVYYWQPFFKA